MGHKPEDTETIADYLDRLCQGKEFLCDNLLDLDTSIINDGGAMVKLEIFDRMTSFIVVVCARGASMG